MPPDSIPPATLGQEFIHWLRGSYSLRRKFLVGVSGGRDSMVLLDLLHSAGFRKLIVCHLNHGLRGTEAGKDAVLAKRITAELGFTFESKKVDVRSLAKRAGQSLEVAARKARHEFFSEAAARHRCREVFLAHHADDQVETILINLFRGTGTRGLSGMRIESQHRIGRRTVTFHRPLLGISRKEIDRYAGEKEISFREDESNLDPDFALRNRVRHRLIPELNAVFDRDIRNSILRLAEVMKSEEALRDAQVEDLFPAMVDSRSQLKTPELGELATADQFRVVHRWLRENRVPACGFEEVARVLTLLSPDGEPAKINLPGGRHARRRAKRIFLE